MLTFGFYIGICIETYILFLLVDFSEVYYQNKNGIQNINSCVASYIIMFFMLMFVLLALWQWCKSRKPENFEKQKYFVAIVDGMKPKWICRSYSFVFLVRRTLFGCVLFFLDFFEAIHRVIILTLIQLVYMLYIIILRPHDSIKENLIDVINEVMYLYFLGFLLHFNTENSWDDTTTDTYFWILMGNNFIIIFITAIFMIMLICKAVFKFCKKIKIIPQNGKTQAPNHTIFNNNETKLKLKEEEKQYPSKNFENIKMSNEGIFLNGNLDGIKTHRDDHNNHFGDLIIEDINHENHISLVGLHNAKI